MDFRQRVLRTGLIIAAAGAIIGSVAGFGSGSSATNSVIASDTFSRSVSPGWGSADQGGSWTILDNAANWSVSPSTGSINPSAGGQERGVLASMSVQDVDILAKIVLPSCTGTANCDAYVIARYAAGSTPTYYRIGVVQGASHSTVFLRSQRNDGSNLTGDLNTGIPASAGVVVWIRADFQGTSPTAITARAWADGTTEPSSWLLNVTDNTSAEQGAGGIGIRVRNEDWGARHVFGYQSYIATALGSSPPPSTSSSSSSSTSSSSTTSTSTTTTTLGPPPPPPNGTAASDSFQRTVPSGWGAADTGGWWTVVGSPWNWSVSPGGGSVSVGAGAQELAYLSQFTVQDVDVTDTVVLPSCSSNTCDAFVLGRYTAAYTPTYYRVGVIQGSSGNIQIRAQRADGTRLVGDVGTSLHAANGAMVMLHVEYLGVNPTTVRARAWMAGTAEPSTWQLNTTDSDSAEQHAGMVGVRLRNEDSSASHTFTLQSYQVTGAAVPASIPPRPSTAAHLLYVVDDPPSLTSPAPMSVFDIDNSHTLLGQIPIPQASKRGLTASPSRGLLYITDCGGNVCVNTGQLIAYDLVHGAVAWIANYSFGVDQLAVTPDGNTIYMPNGLEATDLTTRVLDASDGKPIGSFQTAINGHNIIASLDGSQIYLAGHNYNYVDVLNPATNQVTLSAGPAANGVAPFTINGKHTLLFTTSIHTCGFQVLSATTGQLLYTIGFSGNCTWQTGDPSHGISLSPDEKRVYVMDAPLGQVEVYDVSGVPNSAPTFVASIPTSSLAGDEVPCQTRCAKEGWTLNDLSGRYVYVGDSGDVISTSTLSVVANLPALQNARQMIEVDWMNGAPAKTSTHFGLGRVTS